MSPRIRVAVIEDSTTVRKRLVEVLSGDPEIEVAGEAADGREGVALCARVRPDVVTMDMMLPVMTGLDATEQIMAHCPTPILIVSASINRGELFRTYEAMAAGAVDVLEKPRGDDSDDEWTARFLATVKMVSRIRVITHLRGRLASRAALQFSSATSISQRPRLLTAIGASTGGPGAVVTVLRALPTTFQLPVLLVLHIGAPFGGSFAEWLDTQIGREVRLAEDGMPLSAVGARVMMAPPDRHLVLRGGRLRLTTDAERHSCRPSVDALFESVAQEIGGGATACLLTGMGRDGAAGMLAIRKAGGLTIAQDEATSVVYGMPREAVLLGGAELVLPLPEIGPTLASYAVTPQASRSR